MITTRNNNVNFTNFTKARCFDVIMKFCISFLVISLPYYHGMLF